MRVDGLRVYTLLKQQERTQKNLAESCKISRCTVANIIGGRACSSETAEKIAAALGVSLSEITDKRK